MPLSERTRIHHTVGPGRGLLVIEVGGSHGFPVLQKPYEMDSLAGAVGKLLKQEIPAG